MLKPGNSVRLVIKGRPEQDYKVKGVGPYTVKVVDGDGIDFDVPRKTIAKQLEGARFAPYPVEGRPKEISTPMGGQPKERGKPGGSGRSQHKS